MENNDYKEKLISLLKELKQDTSREALNRPPEYFGGIGKCISRIISQMDEQLSSLGVTCEITTTNEEKNETP